MSAMDDDATPALVTVHARPSLVRRLLKLTVVVLVVLNVAGLVYIGVGIIRTAYAFEG